MFLFAKRPLAFICTMVLLFLFAAPYIGHAGRLAFAALFLLFVLFFALTSAGIGGGIPYPRLFGKYSALIFLLLFLFLLCAAMVSIAHYDGTVGNARAYLREGARITAYADGDDGVVVITSVDGEAVSLRALLSSGDGDSLAPYGYFSASDARIGDIPTAGSVGAYGTYYQSNGIYLLLEAEKLEPLPEEAHTWGRLFYRINTFARGIIYRYVPNHAGFVSAVTLGNRDDADVILKSDFRKLGVSHLLALSGTHFSFMLFGIEFVLKKLRLRKSAVYAVMIVLALLYMSVAGFPLSLVRAGVMYLIYRISYFCGRRGDGVTSLLFAAAVISLVSPTSVYDVGFVLSVSATLAILLFAQPLIKRLQACLDPLPIPKPLRWPIDKVASAVAVALCVLLLIIPVSALLTGTFSTAAVAATLLLSLFVIMILFSAPFLFLFGGIPPVAAIIGFLMDRFAGATGYLSHKMTVYNYTVSLTAPYVKYILILFALLILIAAHLPRRRRLYSVISFCLCAAIFASAFALTRAAAADQNELVIFSDGRGDIVLCISGNRVLLCDETSGSVSLYNDTVAYLQKRNITKVDTLLFTHTHEGHPYLLEKLYGKIHIEAAIFPGDSDHGDIAALTALSERLGIPYESYNRREGLSFSFGDISVSQMGNRAVTFRDPAKGDFTLPLRFRCGEDDVVFAPDASADYMKTSFAAGDGVIYVYGNHVREILPDFSFSDTVTAARALYLPEYADEDYLTPTFAEYLTEMGVPVQHYGQGLSISLSPAQRDP